MKSFFFLRPTWVLVGTTLLGSVVRGQSPAQQFDAVAATVADALRILPPGAIKLSGHVGAQLDLSIEHRIEVQDIPELVAPFRERKDVNQWRSEFWGKWITSAIWAWRYRGDEKLRSLIARGISDLAGTQTADGYIGAYPDGGHLQRWDVWGRKYTLLGLLAWHELSADPAALSAARREADFLLGEVGPGKASPFYRDMWTGMASSSILEPMVLLYRRTGDTRYLDYANYLVNAWSEPGGPDLLRKAQAGTSVFAMFPGPDAQQPGYMGGGSAKAYEMMSCYEGLAELYRTTGRAELRNAVAKVYQNIRDTEITIVGSGSDWERWCDGRRRQTEPWREGIETCVSVTWMKLAAQQLRLSGDSTCGDEIERTMYNALMGAQGTDGAWWCYYTPLAGERKRSPQQFPDIHQSCCVANGPRGLMLLPQLAVLAGSNGPDVVLYMPMQVDVPLADGGRVHLEQKTNYPLSEEVELVVTPDAPRDFTLSLRIPAWSETSTLTINGVPEKTVTPGHFLPLKRLWQAGDKIVLSLDLRTRIVRAPAGAPFVAFVRGPLVLARDARLEGGDTDKAITAPQSVETSLVRRRSAQIWQSFSLQLKSEGGKTGETISLCDFSSAGNTWGSDSRYRVWLPLAR